VAWLLSWGLPADLFPRPRSLVLEDRRGVLLGAAIAPDGQWRLGSSAALPPHYVTALVTYEDKRFFRHGGFDLVALGRAAVTDIVRGRIVSGGSTLSMQVIRLARRADDRNLLEKAIEMMGAVLLEIREGKAGVLRLYADQAPFGGNVVGLEAASWRYFGHESKTLSWAEASLLAVLPNNPQYVRTDRRQDDLRAKRDGLLRLLAARGAFDADTLAASLAEPMPGAPHPLPQTAPHLLVRVASEGGEGRVRTTLDADLQNQVRDVVQHRLAWLSGNAVDNMAVLVLKTSTGEVLSYVGNGEGDTPGGANDMIRTPRSTGSLLKPFLFSRMIETGELLPHQLVEDIPTRIAGFVPRNNVNAYTGALPAAEALARSLNVPASRELQAYGVARFVGDLKDFGLTNLWRNPDDYGLPLILGGAEATLWDLAGAYAGLARRAQGQADAFSAPWAWRGTRQKPGPGPNVSTGAAYLTLDAMKELVRPDEEAGWRLFVGTRKIAWKTGTSSSYKDAWAIGLTPEFVVGVWVGNANGVGRPDLLGLKAAAPALFEVFHRLPPTTWFREPWDDLKAVQVCADSGYLAQDDCPRTVTEWIPKDAQPAGLCPFHRELLLSPDLSRQVDSRVTPVASIVHRVWFVLPPPVAPYYQASHLGYRPPPPVDARIAAWDSDTLKLTVPDPGSKLIIPVELDGTPGRFLAQAYHADPAAVIFWSLDGDYLGQTQGNHVLALRPRAGRHVLTLVDDRGRSVTRAFDVLAESVTERMTNTQR
jgi:penicillin-binding protein 1C